MSRRPSLATLRVLSSFVEQPTTWRHGYEISKTLDIASGTLYPILMRLSERGHLDTQWTESPIEGRPRRHTYRLTPGGRTWALGAIADAKRTGAVSRLGMNPI